MSTPATVPSRKLPGESGAYRAGAALLWSAGAVASGVFLEDVLAFGGLGVGGTLVAALLLVWYVLGLGLIVAALYRLWRRDSWAWLTLFVLVLAPLALVRLDGPALAVTRWQRERPGYEAHRDRVLAGVFETLPLVSASPSGANRFEIWRAEPTVRVVRDSVNGVVRVAFVRYHVGIDGGLAYVYDPSDQLRIERRHSRSSLGWALSGFGGLRAAKPLGGHWYRCIFG